MYNLNLYTQHILPNGARHGKLTKHILVGNENKKLVKKLVKEEIYKDGIIVSKTLVTYVGMTYKYHTKITAVYNTPEKEGSISISNNETSVKGHIILNKDIIQKMMLPPNDTRKCSSFEKFKSCQRYINTQKYPNLFLCERHQKYYNGEIDMSYIKLRRGQQSKNIYCKGRTAKGLPCSNTLKYTVYTKTEYCHHHK